MNDANDIAATSRPSRAAVGSAAGIEIDDLSRLKSTSAPVFISCIDYCPQQHHAEQITVECLDTFLAQHRPPWVAVRWINVDGLTDMKVIQSLARKYHLHPLAVEDLLHVEQRPKVDPYQGEGELQARLFVLMRMVRLIAGRIRGEQICIFLGHTTVLTFQETHGDVWDPIRQRIATTGSRLRTNDASFLVYSLIDAAVDHCFPILEHYGEQVEDLEDRILQNPSQELLQEIHRLKRELLYLRRAVWPMREVVHSIQRESHECFSETTRTYMRDVYDHVAQIIDMIETYREVAIGLTETYMNAVGNRMNQIMKVLTIIGTIFIPLTFLAGVYGMNFHHMPELEADWAYPLFWVICIVLAASMLAWFRRHRWL